MSLKLITCIVELGKADKVVDAALKAGAQAATQFAGRGRGVREKMGTLGNFIMPEKEIIYIVTKEDQAKKVFDVICSTARIEEIGKGFAYIQSVEDAAGFMD